MEGSNGELEENNEMPNETLWLQQVHRVVRSASELNTNVTMKQPRRRRYSFRFICLCIILKHHSSTVYCYLRFAVSKAIPHPDTSRSYAGNDDINLGTDSNHFLSIGSWSDSLEPKELPCIIIYDLGYEDAKIEYSNGDIFRIADNADGIVPAKNVLIFPAQSVADRLRMVLSYYFVKNLDGLSLKKVSGRESYAFEGKDQASCYCLGLAPWSRKHGL